MRGVSATAASLKIFLFFAPFALADDPAPQVAAGPVVMSPAPPEISGYGPFQMDAKLAPRVRFWVDIYAKYHTWESVISDVRYPQLVFAAVDTRDKPAAVAVEKRKITGLLSRLALSLPGIKSGKISRASIKPESLRVLEIFEKENLLSALPEIAGDPKRLRAQSGLRDALEDSLFVSGKYLPRMEALFVRFHLPPEIAYLPFVESGFNKHAVSKVGASGIWQFMPYTGKLYLRVDDVVDERNDPMRAAEAAARLMKQNFDVLGEWPLAITAYNHGTTGVAKAARETGSRQISEIIEKFENKTFGFASQNFYACFLAALHVVKNSETYLGVVPRARRLEFDEFVMPDYMAYKDFIEKMGIDETVFHELNPALTGQVYKGERFIPVGYNVRVPAEASAGFLGRYEMIPAELKFRSQRGAEPTVLGEGEPEAAVPERVPASAEAGGVDAGSASVGSPVSSSAAVPVVDGGGIVVK
jgi:membrane-bound lytic murein transglycosylase D